MDFIVVRVPPVYLQYCGPLVEDLRSSFSLILKYSDEKLEQNNQKRIRGGKKFQVSSHTELQAFMFAVQK